MNICFDLDGTLLDVSNRHYHVYAQAVEWLHGKPLTKRRYWELKRRHTEVPRLLVESSLDPEVASSYMQRFVEQIETPRMLAKDRLIVGTKASLKELSGSHSLYLVSLRRSQSNLGNQLRQLDIEQYFDRILVGHTDGEPYKKKLELIRRLPNFGEGIVVGDTEADIVAAKRLNLRAVAVRSGVRNGEYLNGLDADFVLDGIRELPELVSRL